MKNNISLVINGKKVTLTDEQLAKLGIRTFPYENPFKRVAYDERYYVLDGSGNIHTYSERNDEFDNKEFNEINYFNNEQFANQVALHQLLYRKLLKFAYDNGYEDTQGWNKTNVHWCILYNYNTNQFITECFGSYKYGSVWFSSDIGAKRAIKEVVKPFMKENPDFVW